MKKHLSGISIVIFVFFYFSYASAQVPLTGTKTVGGASSNYPTLTAAVNDLVKNGVGPGGVSFKIRDGIYQERILISSVLGASAANPIVFESESGDPTKVVITSAGGGTQIDHHTLKLFTTKYVTIRKLSIVNTNTSVGSAIHLSGGYQVTELSPVENVTIEDCILSADTLSASPDLVPVLFSSWFINSGSVNTFNSVSVRNCRITGGTDGIRIPTGGANFNLCDISSNSIRTFYRAGIFANLSNLTNTNIRANKVISRKVADDTVRTLYGLYFIFSSSSAFLISNNMLVVQPAGRNHEAYGIYIEEGGITEIAHNSMLIEGIARYSASLAVYRYSATANETRIRNNMLANYAKGHALCFQEQGAASYTYNSDYNNFYTNGSCLSCAGCDLNALQTALGTDAHSVSVLPSFVSPLDLHTFHPAFFEKGEPQADVPEDIDGEARPTAPCIGADEYTLLPLDLALIAVAVETPVLNTPLAVSFTAKNLGTQSLKDSTFYISYTADNGLTWSAPEKFTATKLTSNTDDEVFTLQEKLILPKGKFYTITAKIVQGLQNDPMPGNEEASFTICLPAGGEYLVGKDPGDDFPDLITFTDLLSCAGMSGPVSLILKPGEYVGRVVFPDISQKYALSIRSSTGNPADVLVLRNASEPIDATGTNRPAIEITGYPDVSIRDITMKHRAARGIVLQLIKCDAASIDNCIIQAPTSPSSTLCGGISCSEIHAASITHNRFEFGAYGLSVDKVDSVVVLENDIVSSVNGILLSNCDTPLVRSNRIDVTFQTLGAFPINYGINIVACTNPLVYTNTVRLNPAWYGIALDKCRNPSGHPSVFNNIVYGDFSSTQYANAGINIGSGNTITNDSIFLAFNTISVTGPGIYSYPIVVNKNNRGAILYNNIFHNRRAADDAYSIVVYNGAEIAASDHNNFYAAGSNLALWDNTELSTLSSLKGFTGLDAESISADPGFISDDDLHATNTELADRGIFIEAIPNDFDGEPRCHRYPDIGADEFSDCIDAGVIITSLADNDTVKYNEPVVISILVNKLGLSPLNNPEVSYSVNGVVQATDTLTGSFNTDLPYTFLQSWTPPSNGAYMVCAWSKVPGDIFHPNDTSCILIYADTVSTGLVSVSPENQLLIYPNPANGQVFIKAGSNENSSWCLYNLQGMVIRRGKADLLSGSPAAVTLENIPAGLYIIRISCSAQTSYHKIQIVH